MTNHQIPLTPSAATNSNKHHHHQHLQHEQSLNEILQKFRTFIVALDEEKKRLKRKLARDYPIPADTCVVSDSATTLPLTRHQTTCCSQNNNNKSSDSNTTTSTSSLLATTKRKTTSNNSRLSSTTTHTTSKGEKSTKTWSYRLFPNSTPSSPATNTSSTPPLSISAPFNCQTNYNLIYNKNGRMSTAAGRGCLIVIEGLDRVGKSTLALKLVSKLAKSCFKIEYLKFPERTTPVGQLIDSYLKNDHDELDDHAVHLLYSANRWEYDRYIRKKVSNGTTLVVDRYIYSGIAYSVSKKNMDFNWCHSCEVGLPKPDLVIYLQASRDEQASRPGFGQERFEESDFQDKIRKTYEKLIALNSERWLRFDVDHKKPDELLYEVLTPVLNFMEGKSRKELENIKPIYNISYD